MTYKSNETLKMFSNYCETYRIQLSLIIIISEHRLVEIETSK